ncbi:MAG: TspO/MBR family protein [Acetobacteraceae bacterium]|nr:tryptophan-rich sensory protein [Pseudomonadota bacterium]
MPVPSALALVGFVGLCLLVGAVGGSITARAVQGWYAGLNAPPGTPPNWVFAPVWSVLYVMIGVAAWLVWKRRGPSRPLRLWGWQLAANALWVPAFFGLRSPGLGLVVLAAMLMLTALTILAFLRVRRIAGWLMAPYACWAAYASYLNVGFWLLNRH